MTRKEHVPPLIAEMLGLGTQVQGQVALDERTALVIRDFIRSHTP